MGDTEKVFLQISLAILDRDVVRFIWLTDPPDVKSTRSCIMRIIPVLVRTSSSPFVLTATIRNHLEKYKVTQPHVVNVLKDSVYVDDLIANPSNVEEAYAGKAGAKEILADASVSLRKWTTNSWELKIVKQWPWLRTGHWHTWLHAMVIGDKTMVILSLTFNTWWTF